MSFKISNPKEIMEIRWSQGFNLSLTDGIYDFQTFPHFLSESFTFHWVYTDSQRQFTD